MILSCISPNTSAAQSKRQPHEKYFEKLYEQQKQTNQLMPVPQRLTATAYPNVNISVDTFPQNEPSVAISHKNPLRAMAAWRDFRTGVNPAVRRVGYSYTLDGGATWSTSALLPLPFSDIGYVRTSDPALCVDTAGNFYIATVSIDVNNGNGKLIVYKSSQVGNSYFFPSSQTTIAPNDTSSNNFEDKEYIACDLSPASPYVNNLYICWTRFGPTGGIVLTRSTNSGVSWSNAVPVSIPNEDVQFSDLCVRRNGDVCVSWYEYTPAGTLLHFNKSTNGGQSFGTETVIDTTHFGENGSSSIVTDLTNGLLSGYLYTVWADNRNGDYDVFFSSSSDGGDTWSNVKRVNDDALHNGKDQFWPWLAVDDRGVISIVYYDTRNTPNDSTTETYLAYSWDGGRLFTNVLMSTLQSPRNMPNGAVRYGDYIGIDSWGKNTISVWTDERAGGYNMDIYTAVMDTLPLVTFNGNYVNVNKGWNIASVPLQGTSLVKSYLFPSALSNAFAFEGGYILKETLAVGSGYWMKFGANQTLKLIGDSLTTDTIIVGQGWNLIGSIANPIPTFTITSDLPGIITSNFFGYKGHYEIADTVFPGKGYWVKVSQSGKLILSSSLLATASNRIRIIATTELPPSPPETETQHPTSHIPHQFSLEQNYPNPFNPTTVIQYSVASKQYVSLKVYNILGEVVAKLVDETQDVGFKVVEWDASNMPSGLYYYHLTAGKYIETKKMVLLK